MRIAVNTRFLLPNRLEGIGWFSFEVLRRLVEQHPEHEFIFFFDRPYDERFYFWLQRHPSSPFSACKACHTLVLVV